MARVEVERLGDVCSRKHGGNSQSREANRKAMRNKDAQRMAVLDLIRQHDATGGLSMKEVADLMGTTFNSVSGRGSELKKVGLVYATGESRSGSAVLRAVKGTVATPATSVAVKAPKAAATPTDEPVCVPMPPSQAIRELNNLNELYESQNLPTRVYESALARINKAVELWGTL